MRRSQFVGLVGLAAPVLVLAIYFTNAGCTPDGGGTGVGGTQIFNLPPTVVISADVQRGVAPLQVQFDSQRSTDDGVIVERLWDFDDGSTSNEIAPRHTFQTTGTYNVTLTLTDDQGASANRTLVVSVTEAPVAVINVNRTSAPSAPAQFDFDASQSFDPDAAEDDTLLYTWDFDDGSVEIIPVVTHTFATPGTYNVTLTVTDAVGVTDTASQIIQVGIPDPEITFLSPPNNTNNLVMTVASKLWTHVVFDVEPGTPYFLTAGLDGDTDPCDTQVALYDPTTGAQDLVLEGHSDPIQDAVFSPDGAFVLSAGEDGTVRLYDAETGDFLRWYSGTGAIVSSLAFAPDAQTFVVGYRDGSVLLRDINSDDTIRAFVGHIVAVNCVAFSSDGTQILSGDNGGTAYLWNAEDGTEIFEYDHGGASVTSCAFSPTNAQRVLTGSNDNSARLWSTVNGSLVQEFAPVINEGTLVAGHDDEVRAVAFSPDGTRVATGSADETAIVWSVSDGAELLTLTGHTAAVESVRYAPDGTQIITGSADGTARTWDATTADAVSTFQPCISTVTAVDWSPTGSVLLGIAAENDIQLDEDTTDGIIDNDLNLTLPTGLDLTNVPVAGGGTQYYLWAEVDTDRTDPSRTYSQAVINLIEPMTATVAPETPVIPLVDDRAQVVMPNTTGRRIFDIGPLDTGDRLFISRLTKPGYGETYNLGEIGDETGDSILILDSLEQLYAWYLHGSFIFDDPLAGGVLFSAESKLIIGHASNNYYVVVDTNGTQIPSVSVEIERAFTDDSASRAQTVYLNFAGGNDLAFADSVPFNIEPFLDDPSGLFANPQNVIDSIVLRVEDLLEDYNITVTTTEPANTVQGVHTIYFDVTGALFEDNTLTSDDLLFYGIPNFEDPRNETRSGRALVAASQIVADYPGGDADLATRIGNAAVHQIGLLSGLRETTGTLDDIMTNDRTRITDAGLQFTVADLAAGDGLNQIGIQNAPQILLELFGAATP